MEGQIGETRREDKTIRDFSIPHQEGIGGTIIEISSVQVIRHHEASEMKVNDISLGKNRHLLLSGPNGIGKTTLLESIAHKTAK